MTHVVRRGETLGNIARQYGTTVVDLMRVNGIRNPGMIYEGQALRVPQSTGMAGMAGYSGPGGPMPYPGMPGMQSMPGMQNMQGMPSMQNIPYPGGTMPHTGGSMPYYGGTTPATPTMPYPGTGMGSSEMPGSGTSGMGLSGGMQGGVMDPMQWGQQGIAADAALPTSPHQHHPYTQRLNRHEQRIDELEARVSNLESKFGQVGRRA